MEFAQSDTQAIFLKETETGQDGYPLYRRMSSQDGEFTANINFRGLEVSVDNCTVLPFANKSFQSAHQLRVLRFCEVCKFVNKRPDMTVFELISGENDLNECHHYQMEEYIRSNEAVWRILNFPIHDPHPTVIHISMHL
ncbi:hypothetical protein AVEN_16976-1 [Araneus ventricosus]|uniref:Uncharacterized protein n=1 Tax=Araneus ventricosus TaxID=182803 RepID=A0A4Y2D6F9_ARAVE|nr:hypothetical protein AVEN_16976-1 [Araneus ventricosus]